MRGRRPRVDGDGGDGGAAEHALIHPFPGAESRDPAQSVGLAEDMVTQLIAAIRRVRMRVSVR
jgi:hypothetical protein